MHDANPADSLEGSALPQTVRSTDQWIWSALALMLVLASGWMLRAWVLFSAPLLPGLNGAYYPVQARAILHTGLLGIPDFPLLFYFQAGLGAVISLFTSTGRALFDAVRLTDTVLPVLLAIPVFCFIRAFDGDRQKKAVIALAVLMVGFIAVGNGGLLRMAGDFQKNAAALPLYLSFVYFLYRSFRDSRRRDYLLTFLFFSLTCVTHIGVAALAITTALFAGIAGLMTTRNRGRALVMISLLAVALFLVMMLVSLFDIHRVTKLFGMAINPGLLFSDSRIRSLLGMNPGPGMQFEGESMSLGIILGLLGIMVALYHPKKLESADRAILWATSLCALLFASPFFGGDWSQRLSLMAFAPGLVPLAFLTVRVRWGLVVTVAVMTVVLLTSARDLPSMTHQGITAPAYRELVSLKSSLPEGKNLIIARHGLEWWAAWTMNAKIANNVEAVLDTWEKYDAVWYLEETDSTAFSLGDMRRPGGHAGGPPSFSGNMRPGGTPPGNLALQFPDEPDSLGGPGGLGRPDRPGSPGGQGRMDGRGRTGGTGWARRTGRNGRSRRTGRIIRPRRKRIRSSHGNSAFF